MKILKPKLVPFMVQAHMDLGSGSGVGCNSKQLEDGTWEFNWEEKKGFTPPTDAEIKTRADELQAEFEAQAYARDRAESYPSVGDQLDMLMKDMKDGTTTHQTACEAVKTKFPKP